MNDHSTTEIKANDWASVDRYLTDTLVGRDDVLEDVLTANARAGLPPHDVSPAQGKFLMLLCRLMNARTVLEIGTLGGYSTIWIARGVGDGGQVVTLEADPDHAEVATANLARAGVERRVEVVVGAALDTMPTLAGSPNAPFDVVFIDADKPNNPHYLDWALRLTRPGSVIIGDNVVREGQVANGASEDDRVTGVRRFLELLRDDPRIDATALQTVGMKGWDGFSLGVVI